MMIDHQSHFLKVPTLPYHALISIVQKFPVTLDSRVFWTNALRDRLFGEPNVVIELHWRTRLLTVAVSIQVSFKARFKFCLCV